MKSPTIALIALAAVAARARSGAGSREAPDFSSISRTDSGRAVAVMLTSYSTTLPADGEVRTRLRSPRPAIRSGST